MKICPICKKTYDDDYEYCEEDGALLVESASAGPTPEEQKSPVSKNPDEKEAVSPASNVVHKKYKCPNCGWEGESEDEFCPQCGAKLIIYESGSQIVQEKSTTKAKLIIMKDSTEIKIDKFPFEFGRSLIDNYPDSQMISRRHFLLTEVEKENGNNEIYIEDLGSTNGTSLNDNIIGENNKSLGKFQIKDGDIIGLVVDSKGKGLFELQFRIIKNES